MFGPSLPSTDPTTPYAVVPENWSVGFHLPQTVQIFCDAAITRTAPYSRR